MTSKSVCPFCLWAVCGLVLVFSAPELTRLGTRLGPALLWLVLIPFASALLGRALRRAAY